MANKGEKKINKSKLIRDTKRDNPSLGPTDMSAMLKETHGVDINPAMISTVLSQDRIRGGKPLRRGRPPKGSKKSDSAPKANSSSEGLSIESLVQAKLLADKMGGIGEAKAALDALSRLFR